MRWIRHRFSVIANGMSAPADHIDKPEPRWQAILALLAIGGIHLALLRWFIVGPIWLLPGVIVVLLVPTIMSHRTGRHSLNHALGIVINAIITLALIGSVVLLVTTLQSHKEAPLRLLGSGAARWRPVFFDYLFIAFTQSSTFGPTDAPLLARWAKGLAMCQIFISLSIVVLLISRAVGVL